jgi:hypothetical protein
MKITNIGKSMKRSNDGSPKNVQFELKPMFKVNSKVDLPKINPKASLAQLKTKQATQTL